MTAASRARFSAVLSTGYSAGLLASLAITGCVIARSPQDTKQSLGTRNGYRLCPCVTPRLTCGPPFDKMAVSTGGHCDV